MKIAFVNRPIPERCLAKSQTLAPMLAWAFLFASILIGYLLNGPDFFTLNHLLQPHGFSYHPVIGLPILAFGLGWLVYWTLDNVLGAPCYLGVHMGCLLVNRRRAIPLWELKLSEARQSAEHSSVVEILDARNGTVRLRVPALMTKLSAAEIMVALQGLDAQITEHEK